MNALYYLGHAAQLITEVDTCEAGRWMLYVRQHELKIKPAAKVEPGDHILAYLQRLDIEKGMTPRAWNRIDAAIRRAIAEGVL